MCELVLRTFFSLAGLKMYDEFHHDGHLKYMMLTSDSDIF